MEIKSIPMEAETIPLLIGGFSIVMAIVLIFVTLLMFRRKKLSYAWFVVQGVFLTGTFYCALKVLDSNVEATAMVSESTSLLIGVTAVLWGTSMICMLMGIWGIGENKHTA